MTEVFAPNLPEACISRLAPYVVHYIITAGAGKRGFASGRGKKQEPSRIFFPFSELHSVF